MTPEETRQLVKQMLPEIIREEIGSFVLTDRFLIYRLMQFADGRNIQLGLTTGTKIGTAVGQRIGFWGVTPIIQPTSSNQAAVATTGATQTTPWGFTTEAQANGIITLLNRLRTDLVSAGIIKGS